MLIVKGTLIRVIHALNSKKALLRDMQVQLLT